MDEKIKMMGILIDRMKNKADVTLINEINALKEKDEKSFRTDYSLLRKKVDESNVAYNTTLQEIAKSSGGRYREMNMKDIKELCKANQIKLSRVVDGKRVAYKKKELMTKLKRKKLL